MIFRRLWRSARYRQRGRPYPSWCRLFRKSLIWPCAIEQSITLCFAHAASLFFPFPQGDGCGKAGVPGVYARVSAAVSWIDSTVCGTFGVGEFCGGATAITASPPASGGGDSGSGSHCTNDASWTDL